VSARVLQVDLAHEIIDRVDVAGYERARVLLRWGRRVVGAVDVPITQGVLRSSDIRSALAKDVAVRDRLAEILIEERLLPGAPSSASPSTWTVVVCTRDRTEMLRACLDSLVAANDGSGEIIVVDNAPSSNATELLAAAYPVRYVREERPGLNWARALGARLAAGEIVAFTDDDVVVDPDWVPALLRPFADKRVGAVTGLTMPFELETESQELFELYGGFGRGFSRREFDYRGFAPPGAGAAGAGANMAFRRSLLVEKGLFETEFDSGTVTRTGGDTYALYRVLADGYKIIYSPDALNWHRHRRDRAALRSTLNGYGVGLYAFLTRCVVQHGDLPALRIGLSWFGKHYLRELARTLARRPNRLPLDLVLAELRGALRAPFAYFQSRRIERRREPGVTGERTREAA
jgi:GT2 family glycosyltransferase